MRCDVTHGLRQKRAAVRRYEAGYAREYICSGVECSFWRRVLRMNV